MRIAQAKEEERRKRNIGLGGLLRRGGVLPAEPVGEDDIPLVRSSIPSPSKLVGGSSAGSMGGSSFSMKKPSEEAPPVVKKKGLLLDRFEQYEKDKEEHEKIKVEKMNQIYLKKMEEKQKKEGAQLQFSSE